MKKNKNTLFLTIIVLQISFIASEAFPKSTGLLKQNDYINKSNDYNISDTSNLSELMVDPSEIDQFEKTKIPSLKNKKAREELLKLINKLAASKQQVKNYSKRLEKKAEDKINKNAKNKSKKANKKRDAKTKYYFAEIFRSVKKKFAKFVKKLSKKLTKKVNKTKHHKANHISKDLLHDYKKELKNDKKQIAKTLKVVKELREKFHSIHKTIHKVVPLVAKAKKKLHEVKAAWILDVKSQSQNVKLLNQIKSSFSKSVFSKEESAKINSVTQSLQKHLDIYTQKANKNSKKLAVVANVLLKLNKLYATLIKDKQTVRSDLNSAKFIYRIARNKVLNDSKSILKQVIKKEKQHKKNHKKHHKKNHKKHHKNHHKKHHKNHHKKHHKTNKKNLSIFHHIKTDKGFLPTHATKSDDDEVLRHFKLKGNEKNQYKAAMIVTVSKLLQNKNGKLYKMLKKEYRGKNMIHKKMIANIKKVVRRIQANRSLWFLKRFSRTMNEPKKITKKLNKAGRKELRLKLLKTMGQILAKNLEKLQHKLIKKEARKIKRKNRFPALRVLRKSAYRRRHHAIDYGLSAFIVKTPIINENALKMYKKLFGKKSHLRKKDSKNHKNFPLHKKFNKHHKNSTFHKKSTKNHKYPY